MIPQTFAEMRSRPDPGRRVLIVAPHPDDETLGAAGQLDRLGCVWIAYVTDGSPRDLRDARAAGLPTRESYAQARRRELEAALRVAGIGANRAISLGFVDQEASRCLVEITRELVRVLHQVSPDLILAPAYEGGHPDHDATAFSVHWACRMMPGSRVFEYALYRAGEHGGIAAGAFLERPDAPIETFSLSPPDADRKRRMLACFVTQQQTLAPFPIGQECFREAPQYDFETAPHEGRLYYENFDWGVTGNEWRALAAEASRRLEEGLV